eukprot:GFYU01009618.1.p1 GENE.GFYU01009618.1~~GFYU01009618.1.p1  ORF type:complete len:669 (-),score=160.31 GFYU01009618.1:48-2054(-)
MTSFVYSPDALFGDLSLGGGRMGQPLPVGATGHAAFMQKQPLAFPHKSLATTAAGAVGSAGLLSAVSKFTSATASPVTSPPTSALGAGAGSGSAPATGWPLLARFRLDSERLARMLTSPAPLKTTSKAIMSEVASLCCDIRKLYYDEGAEPVESAMALLNAAITSPHLSSEEVAQCRTWFRDGSFVLPSTFGQAVQDLTSRVMWFTGQFQEGRELFSLIQTCATTVGNDGFHTLDQIHVVSCVLQQATSLRFTTNQLRRMDQWLSDIRLSLVFASKLDGVPADVSVLNGWLKRLKSDFDLKRRFLLPVQFLHSLITVVPDAKELKVQKILYGLVQKAYRKCEKLTTDIRKVVQMQSLLEAALGSNLFTNGQQKELRRWLANTIGFVNCASGNGSGASSPASPSSRSRTCSPTSSGDERDAAAIASQSSSVLKDAADSDFAPASPSTAAATATLLKSNKRRKNKKSKATTASTTTDASAVVVSKSTAGHFSLFSVDLNDQPIFERADGELCTSSASSASSCSRGSSVADPDSESEKDSHTQSPSPQQRPAVRLAHLLATKALLKDSRKMSEALEQVVAYLGVVSRSTDKQLRTMLFGILDIIAMKCLPLTADMPIPPVTHLHLMPSVRDMLALAQGNDAFNAKQQRQIGVWLQASEKHSMFGYANLFEE